MYIHIHVVYCVANSKDKASTPRPKGSPLKTGKDKVLEPTSCFRQLIHGREGYWAVIRSLSES